MQDLMIEFFECLGTERRVTRHHLIHQYTHTPRGLRRRRRRRRKA